MITNESIKLKLLAGLTFPVDDICEIKPWNLLQVIDYGYDKYHIALSMLLADVKDYQIEDVDLSELTYWDILIHNISYGDEKYVKSIYEAINIFLNEGIYFDAKDGVFCTAKGKVIDKNVFDKIREILKWQNCVEEKKQPKMANTKAEEIRKKILKGREELNKKSGNQVTFDDLVSVLSAHGNNLNILNIWDLTIYQFNNQFNRMQMIEDYDINFRYLLAGANKDDVKLKHYIRPIEANIEE